MATRDDLLATLPVARAFEALGVRYYIGGSVASSAFGVIRSTADVVFVAELAERHVVPLVRMLGDDYYTDEQMIRDAIRQRSSVNFIHIPTSYKVDVFVAKQRRFDEAAWERVRRHAPFEGSDEQFPIASPEDVILSKLEWYRLGDEMSERQWGDILGVMKVQEPDLNRAYLDHWAKELGVSDPLQRAWLEAGV